MKQLFRHLRASFQTERIDSPSRHASRVQPFPIDWVIPQVLAVGGLPQPLAARDLAQAGVQVVLSLCSEEEGRLPETIRQAFHCVSSPIPDSRSQETLQLSQLVTAVHLVHEWIGRRQPVYVHCLAGMERSPTVCIAYLCRHQGMELWEATHWVKQAHPASMPTADQVRLLREFVLLKH